MTLTKKLTIGTAASVLFIALTFPYYVSIWFNSEIDHLVESFAETYQFKVNKTKAYSGYRVEQIVYDFDWDVPEFAENEQFSVAFSVSLDARFGPFYDTSASEWRWFDADIDLLHEGRSLFVEYPPAALISKVGGDSAFILDLGKENIFDGIQDVQLRLSNVFASVVENSNDQILVRTHLPRLSLDAPPFLLSIINAQSTSELKDVSMIWQGHEVASVDKMTFYPKQAGVLPSIEVSNMESISNSDLTAQGWQGNVRIDVASLDVNDKHFGPLSLNLNSKGWDIESLLRMQTEFAKIEEKYSANPEAVAVQTQTYIKRHLYKAFVHNPRLDVMLKVDQANQPFEANLHASVKDIEGRDFDNPMNLASKLTIDIDLLIPEYTLIEMLSTPVDLNQVQRVFASTQAMPVPMPGISKPAMTKEQAIQMIAQFVESGYLVQEGEGYRFQAIFHEGKLRLNGKEMPLPMLPQ